MKKNLTFAQKLASLFYIMQEEIIDLLIVSQWSMQEVAQEFGITINEVKKIWKNYEKTA